MSLPSLDEFIRSGLSLAVYHDGVLAYDSKRQALAPLLAYILKQRAATGPAPKRIVVFDKHIGRAAALLMTLVNPSRIYAGNMSHAAIEVFEERRIMFEADRIVEFLMDVASKDTCRWEKLAAGKTAEGLLAILQGEE